MLNRNVGSNPTPSAIFMGQLMSTAEAVAFLSISAEISCIKRETYQLYQEITSLRWSCPHNCETCEKLEEKRIAECYAQLKSLKEKEDFLKESMNNVSKE